jgi:hypothetical protein
MRRGAYPLRGEYPLRKRKSLQMGNTREIKDEG